MFIKGFMSLHEWENVSQKYNKDEILLEYNGD